jgi:hypothetical protein
MISPPNLHKMNSNLMDEGCLNELIPRVVDVYMQSNGLYGYLNSNLSNTGWHL